MWFSRGMTGSKNNTLSAIRNIIFGIIKKCYIFDTVVLKYETLAVLYNQNILKINIIN